MNTTLIPRTVFPILAIFFCGIPPLFAQTTGWKTENLPSWPSPVSPDAMVVEGSTDIKWIPLPYTFEQGESVRYIDFDNGDDNNTGDTKAAAWKHHPWDADATGNAAATAGIHTYVFKGGVTYRGALVGKESGTEAEPIRLTRDPDWGQGPAILAGSEAISPRWTPAATGDLRSLGMPDQALGKIWQMDIGTAFEPWGLWTVNPDGSRTRQNLARWPNWEKTHPYNHFTQWYTNESKADDKFPRTTISSDKLKGFAPDAFKGATIWIDHPNTSSEFTIMGPVSSSVGRYNPEEGSLQPELNHPARRPAKGSPFFLENKGWFLDEAGEWFFDKDTGKLYLWLPNDANPNTTQVEVARHRITLDLQGVQHIEISGLTFTGGNSIDPKDAVDVGGYSAPEHSAVMPAIRLLGDCRHIDLHHLDIRDTVGGGITNLVTDEKDIVSHINISDSRFVHLDNDGIDLMRGFSWRKVEDQPKARLTDLTIYRNYMHDIGLRGMSPASAGKAINLNGPEVADIAGNVIHYVAAHGININGGRPTAGWMGSNAAETPMIRIQVRQNKVDEALLYKTDFGNIEFWQTGPVYVYSNLSINPIGYIAHRKQYHKNEAFYFDHGVKGYLFNNIGWSDERDDAYQGIIGTSFYKDVRTHWNMMFQNTSMNFRTHYAHEGAAGDQQQIIGNLMVSNADIGGFISYWRLKEASDIAISRNLAYGKYELFYNRWRGDKYRSIEGMRDAVANSGNFLAKDIGWVTDDSPVVNAASRDFRLTDNSPAIDRGAKVFVPWSLYGTVGEWYFRLRPEAPEEVLSYDLYPQEFYSSTEIMRLGAEMPDNRLVGEGITAENYMPGILEDWTPQSALRLDGSQVLTLPHAKLVKDFSFKRRGSEVNVTGTDRRTVRMQNNNFAIEAVLMPEANPNNAVLAAKTDGQNGYTLSLNPSRHPVVTLTANGQSMDYVSQEALPPETWSHLLAEVDRKNGTVTFYINGNSYRVETEEAMFPASVSIDNEADFMVGQNFVGALDFMRVSRGTLADANTTIDELMSWQFNGPHLHDFVGRAVVGERRDIGALEHPSASGTFAINYTPPPAEEEIADTPKTQSADVFLTGTDRTVKTTDWGTLSVPKQVAQGDTALVQVAFPTETIPKEMQLRIDLHGFVNGKRETGMGRAAPIKVKPGVTTPYSADLSIPKKDGLTRVNAVIYVSPTGGWNDKLFVTEVGMDVLPAGSKIAPAKAEPKESSALPPAPKDMEVHELKWATVYIPKSAKVNDEVTIRIDLAEDAVTAPTKLYVDTHWFEGKTRKTGGPRVHPIPVKPGGDRSFTRKLNVPKNDGITAVQYVIYMTADGSWKNKSHSGSAGMKVEN